MDKGVTDLIFVRLAQQQIEQAIFAYIPFIIIVYNQACIKETIIPKLVVKKFLQVMVMFEDLLIRNESYPGAIWFTGFFFFKLLNKKSIFKLSRFLFPIPESAYFKITA